LAVAKDVQSQEGNLGIVIDAFPLTTFFANVSPTISEPIVIILELLWPLVIYPERSSDTSAAIMPLILLKVNTMVVDTKSA
jgi:hypothetical protein